MKSFLVCSVAVVLLTAFAGCSSSDDDIVTSSKSVELASKKTSQINYSDSKATFSSEDEFVASVSATGLITANRIGETYIDVNGKKSVKVTVTPVITSFLEPQILFGATRSEVIAKVGTSYSGSSENGLLYSKSSGRVSEYGYFFKDGKVSSVAMFVNTLYLDSLSNFILERYMPATFSQETNTAFFINALTLKKATMVIGEKVYSSSLMLVVYMPNNSSNSSSMVAGDNQKCMEQVNEWLQQMAVQ